MIENIEKSLAELESLAVAAKSAPIFKKAESIEKVADKSLAHARLLSNQLIELTNKVEALTNG